MCTHMPERGNAQGWTLEREWQKRVVAVAVVAVVRSTPTPLTPLALVPGPTWVGAVLHTEPSGEG